MCIYAGSTTHSFFGQLVVKPDISLTTMTWLELKTLLSPPFAMHKHLTRCILTRKNGALGPFCSLTDLRLGANHHLVQKMLVMLTLFEVRGALES